MFIYYDNISSCCACALQKLKNFIIFCSLFESLRKVFCLCELTSQSTSVWINNKVVDTLLISVRKSEENHPTSRPFLTTNSSKRSSWLIISNNSFIMTVTLVLQQRCPRYHHRQGRQQQPRHHHHHW